MEPRGFRASSACPSRGHLLGGFAPEFKVKKVEVENSTQMEDFRGQYQNSPLGGGTLELDGWGRKSF